MYENRRTKELALLGIAAMVLAIGAIVPAFAWTSTLTTQIQCNGSPCSSTVSIPAGTVLQDKATLTLTKESSCLGSGSNCGTVSFYVVSGAAPKSCPSKLPSGAVAEGVSVVPTSADSGTPQTLYSSNPTLAAGTYYFYVVYSGTTGGGYPAAYACEPFSGGAFPPPPSGVPQFPLGMGLLLVLAIPGLLLAKKYTGKKSVLPV
jgi:hypothetical protein